MLLSSDALWILLGALALDALVGDPEWLWRRAPHPVAWIGALIGALERALNRQAWAFARRKLAGALALFLLLATAILGGWVGEMLLRRLPAGEALVALVASVLLAQKSLYEHVTRVRDAFAAGGLSTARGAVATIVGRDPESLDEGGVCRAAIESAAENFSDGVVAPAFWFALFGLPGLVAYKALNTADSMIGHRTPRFEAFGWAAARSDDLANLVPARLAGALLALAAAAAGGGFRRAFRVMCRDARLHRSPNAGWPESAMAGALGLALAGPRRYGDVMVHDAFLNAEARSAAKPDDIARALLVMLVGCVLQAGLYAALALLL